ncbi:hypothetical protein HJC23_008280 [Cyclotella cryptica]|uniref:Uncharacterized protein n=1 Tax=Cyclotella cryptica TaxID=29204 RepID=A0ABD3PBC8_9STRA
MAKGEKVVSQEKEKKKKKEQPKEKPREEKGSCVDITLPGDSQHDGGNIDKWAILGKLTSLPSPTARPGQNIPHPLQSAKTSLTPYNPHTPNDYLANRERRKTAAVREDMQAARKKVEEERTRIDLSGDVDKIMESLGGVVGEAGLGGGGVERQQEKELGAAEKKEDGQCDDAHDNHEKAQTISLINMVAPGQVNNELSFEFCEECGRDGKVLNVAIIDAHSNQEHVWVDVTFENKDSAVETKKC